MIQKCIHDDFQLDLSSYELNIVDENQWFNDTFFTQYTLPFDIDLTKEDNIAFAQILDYAIASPTTYYEIYFFFESSHYAAILEVTQIQDRTATLQISFGEDEFPSWNKKLGELSLEVQTLTESLFDHAPSVVNKQYPATNYNFVQVHTDSFDPEDSSWNGFEGIVNNAKDGVFVVNEFDDEENILYNRNIMIPMPYFLHVLTQGFADAGFQLKGDVLKDEDFKNALFYREAEEYINASLEGVDYNRSIDTFDELVAVEYRYGAFNLSKATRYLGQYEDELLLDKRGRYKISGVIYLRRQFSDARGEVFYKGNRIGSFYKDYIRREPVSESVVFVDIDVDIDDITEPLVFKNRQIKFAVVNEETIFDAPLWDLTITAIALFDENDELVPAVVTTDKIDLRYCVPDITFGDFVKALKNWKNLDMIIDGDDVHMNYIQPNLQVNDAVDLRQYEERSPLRKFNQGESYLLQFNDISSDDYVPGSLYITINGVETESAPDDANEIEIDAVPLPLVLRNNVVTALAVATGDDDICVVIYKGGSGAPNIAQDNTGILIDAVYDNYWADWIAFRIKAQEIVTDFNMKSILALGIKVNSQILMYNNYFLIESLNKTIDANNNISNIELELASIK